MPAVSNLTATSEDSPLYASDEFRIFCFKAKRRDVRTCNYSGVACPEMKKNMHCPRGDRCSFAHNVFEYWLHPSRYRTQLCNEGLGCQHKTCFFAHSIDQLRITGGKSGQAGPNFELDPFSNRGPKRSQSGKPQSKQQLALPESAQQHAATDLQLQYQLLASAKAPAPPHLSSCIPNLNHACMPNKQHQQVTVIPQLLLQQQLQVQQQQQVDSVMQLARAMSDMQLQQKAQQMISHQANDLVHVLAMQSQMQRQFSEGNNYMNLQANSVRPLSNQPFPQAQLQGNFGTQPAAWNPSDSGGCTSDTDALSLQYNSILGSPSLSYADSRPLDYYSEDGLCSHH
eukprot:gene5512-3722_t